jgi:CcmD family protein
MQTDPDPLIAPPPPADTTIALLDPGAAQALATQPPQGIERAMLAEDKLPVVLAVVLVIWLGLLLLLFRTDRRLARIERDLRS